MTIFSGAVLLILAHILSIQSKYVIQNLKCLMAALAGWVGGGGGQSELLMSFPFYDQLFYAHFLYL